MKRIITPCLLAAVSIANAQFGPQHFAFTSDVQYPYRIQFVDLNGDGHVDAISQENYDLYWWPNDGNGNFPERLGLAYVEQVSANEKIVFTDVDMDGDPDLICERGWWANDGNGQFTFVSSIATYLMLAMVGDVDGDGDPDLVGRAGLTFFGTVINDGNGNFTNGVQLGSTTAYTINATQADFDGDGDQDLVVGGDANLVGYYPNLGLGSFGPREVVPNVAGTPVVDAGDMDDDGDPDLLVYGSSPGNRWFANDGSAQFAVADTISGGSPLADLDGDGDLDLSQGTGTSCDVKWSRNDGAGLAWATQTIELFTGYNLVGTRYAYADVDGDGDLDAGIVHGLGMIAWYPNEGGGSFGPRQRIGHVLSGGSGMSVTDLDGDGDNDIAAAGYYGDWITTYANNGDGTFAQQEVVIEHLDQVNTCRAADLDGDGFPELLTNKAIAAVLWNDGTGHFTPGTLPNNGVATLPADLDGDFDLDLIGGGVWYRNEGSGLFTEILEPQLAISGSTPMKTAYLNDDAFLDVLCVGTAITALLNDGSGVFTAVTSTTSANINTCDVADVDLDGDIDFFALTGTIIRGYYNDGNGAFTELQLTPGDVGQPRHILAFDINGDEFPDAVWARSNGYDHKTFANLNNGDGTLGASFIVDPYAESTASLAFADVNGDVVPDLVESRFHTIAWQENHFFDAFRLRGDVFKDYDQDGVRDASDDPQAFSLMRTEPASVLSWTNSFGQFDMAVDSGVTYQLWPQLPAIYQVTTTPDTAIVQANALEPIVDSLLFGLGPVIDEDAEYFSFTRTLMRCDTQGSFYVDVRNAGGTIITDISVSLAIDPDLTLLSAFPPPDSIVGSTVYWSIGSLVWFAIEHFRVDVGVGPVGSSALATATVHFGSTGETFEEVIGVPEVSCAFDPNDKLVLPEGEGVHHAVPIDQDWLDYTIRFQNTGTDTAFNVLLIDRLSNQLDWPSMEILGTSHPLTNIFIEADGELNFRYDHINLPDSGANMAGSNGYVRFRMRPLPGLPNLTEIHNTAEIYFDFNAPVVTNTTLTTLVDCDAFEATITALDVDLLEASEGESYQWYQDGVAMPGATAQQVLVAATGLYTVEVTNAYGCVLLSEGLQVVITSMQENTALHMAVVPNPVSDNARILFSAPLPSDARIELIDVNGRLLRNWKGIGTREMILTRDGLAAGLYTLRVAGQDGSLFTARLVME